MFSLILYMLINIKYWLNLWSALDDTTSHAERLENFHKQSEREKKGEWKNKGIEGSERQSEDEFCIYHLPSTIGIQNLSIYMLPPHMILRSWNKVFPWWNYDLMTTGLCIWWRGQKEECELHYVVSAIEAQH